MSADLNRRRLIGWGLGASATLLLAGCETVGFNLAGSRPAAMPVAAAVPSSGDSPSFGTGRVHVAMLLPLSGDPGLATVGISMANAAQLAMDFITRSAKLGDNITLTVLDTGSSPQGAAQRAGEAVAAGASLILGPLKGDQVQAAGAVARGAGVPLIGFSNNSAVAAPGVYLLNVLPESEVHRSLSYAAAHGHHAIAGIFANTDFGRVQGAAFQSVAANAGMRVAGVYAFNSEHDGRPIVMQLAPRIMSGEVDTVFLPDRASAPAFAALLQGAGVPQGKALLIGSADWDKDPAIAATPYLAGAVYPAVDDAGFRALTPDYTARFGTEPHPLATIAYTAVILANAAPLANAHYAAAQLTMPGGFSGRDGVFRFTADGRSQYALVMKQVIAGGAQRIDGPRL